MPAPPAQQVFLSPDVSGFSGFAAWERICPARMFNPTSRFDVARATSNRDVTEAMETLSVAARWHVGQLIEAWAPADKFWWARAGDSGTDSPYQSHDHD
jgi:hypothetical protein